MRARLISFGLLITGVLLLCGCSTTSSAETLPSPHHVIILAFDGWGASSFDRAEMPFLKGKLMDSAWTLHKRSVLPTSSACNWASMFKGAGPEAHGYTEWNTKAPVFDITYSDEKGLFPSIFSIYRRQYPFFEMGYFYQWEGMQYVVDLSDFSRNKKFAVSVDGSDKMANAAVSYIKDCKPAIAVFIWDFPDKTGHTDGWYTPEYYTELAHIDSIIELIYKTCQDAGIIEDTLFVITSDHGGHDKTHHQPIMSDLETPFILFGKGVRPGEIKTPLMQYDVASILADYLRIEQPVAWRGKTPRGLFL